MSLPSLIEMLGQCGARYDVCTPKNSFFLQVDWEYFPKGSSDALWCGQTVSSVDRPTLNKSLIHGFQESPVVFSLKCQGYFFFQNQLGCPDEEEEEEEDILEFMS